MRQPRHTNLAAVQVAVAGAGALGVNAEDLTLLQLLQGNVERFERFGTVGAVHGDDVHGFKERLHHLAARAGGVHVLSLGEERHAARHHGGNNDGVQEGQVVGGDNYRAVGGEVFESGHAGAEDGAQDSGDCFLGGFVEKHVNSPEVPIDCGLWRRSAVDAG